MKFENGEYRHVSLPQEVDRLEPFMRKSGQPCPFIIPKGHAVNNLKSWACYRADINNTLEALETVLKITDREKSVEKIILQSLISSGIVSYCKCYDSKNGRTTKVNPRKVFKGKSELLKIHEKIKRIRNTYIAHGDKSDYERVSVRVALVPESAKKEHLVTYSFLAKYTLPMSQELDEFIDAAKLTKRFIERKIDILYEKISAEVDLKSSKVYTVDDVSHDLSEGFKLPTQD